MAKKNLKIGDKTYTYDLIRRVNYWHSCGYTNESIAKQFNLTEKEVIDILNCGRI